MKKERVILKKSHKGLYSLILSLASIFVGFVGFGAAMVSESAYFTISGAAVFFALIAIILGIFFIKEEGKSVLAIFGIIIAALVILSIVSTTIDFMYPPAIPEVNSFHGMSLSPDNKFLAFSYGKYSNSSIYLLNLKNSDLRVIAHSEDYSYLEPSYSSDGSKIIFIGRRDKIGGSINIINSDGTNGHEILKSEYHFWEAIFLPGKDNFAFVRAEINKTSLNIAKLDGSNQKELVASEEAITKIVSSKDGNTIYFIAFGYFGSYSPVARAGLHEADIYGINITGGIPTKLTQFGAYSMGSLSFVSNKYFKDHLVFEKVQSSEEGYNWAKSIYLLSLKEAGMSKSVTYIALNGSLPELKNRFNYSLEQSSPKFSSDGDYLGFLAVSNDTWLYDYNVFLASISDFKPKQITNFDNVEDYLFFNDNQTKIIVVTNNHRWNAGKDNEVWVVDFEGNANKIIGPLQ